MIPVAMQKHDDCLSAAIASLLELPLSEVPYCEPSADWDAGWLRLVRWCASRGWYLFEATESEPTTLADRTRNWGSYRYYWIASVTHPSWPDNEAHVIVMRGAEVSYDPAVDTGERPPLEELTVAASFHLLPLDPARFTYGRAKERAA